ncbi:MULTISPECIES: hypothetical protein [Mycobacterium]|uniref:hypothetical protein n=1 Tax=Mycobacterium TaxID=1763 RepID=UPI0005ED52D8|nr:MULTISPECIES: hypothetical protein [Mycobacterium]MCV7034843.1 hypothetical protein [Mycobacterium heckeshornense]
MTAEELRTALIEVLTVNGGPTTTSAARLAVTQRNGAQGCPVVAEQVYRALLILQRRGIVRRVHDQPGRLAHWELTHSYRRHHKDGGDDDQI